MSVSHRRRLYWKRIHSYLFITFKLFPFFTFNFSEPPQETEDCPHQFGYYRLGDAQNCGQFKNCVDGRGYIFDCPEGLAFNEDSYRCDWPDQVASCDAECKIKFLNS